MQSIIQKNEKTISPEMTLEEKFKIWNNTPREECPLCLKFTILDQHNCQLKNEKKFDKDFLFYLYRKTTCGICYKTEHPNSYCPIVTCKICKEKGHITKNCSNKPNTTEEMKNYWKQEPK
ncbi:9836_t:CDS:2 [Racocetra persica]|uniref:9836_t:CDS:1 n=1 Tax=Racocetra persica TaxID=160502 RepID=A0ACA9LR81_9GLOM|nr:9836_t:CDS:2 [Racocetra persica]